MGSCKRLGGHTPNTGLAQPQAGYSVLINAKQRMLTPVFADRYRAVMQAVWCHPDNDQRPAVLNTLTNWCPRERRILDIGAGAGYYLSALRPRQVMAVEPDPVFRAALQDVASAGGFPMTSFASVAALRGQCGEDWDADLVCMIHALYYLKEVELQWLLPLIGERDLILVYPDPAEATTVAFEDAIGLGYSRRRLAIKEQTLGEPCESRRIASHFRLQGDTSSDDLAFLIAHLLLRAPGVDWVLEQALAFVAERISAWRRQSFVELPQPQIMELYRRRA